MQPATHAQIQEALNKVSGPMTTLLVSEVWWEVILPFIPLSAPCIRRLLALSAPSEEVAQRFPVTPELLRLRHALHWRLCMQAQAHVPPWPRRKRHRNPQSPPSRQVCCIPALWAGKHGCGDHTFMQRHPAVVKARRDKTPVPQDLAPAITIDPAWVLRYEVMRQYILRPARRLFYREHRDKCALVRDTLRSLFPIPACHCPERCGAKASSCVRYHPAWCTQCCRTCHQVVRAPPGNGKWLVPHNAIDQAAAMLYELVMAVDTLQTLRVLCESVTRGDVDAVHLQLWASTRQPAVYRVRDAPCGPWVTLQTERRRGLELWQACWPMLRAINDRLLQQSQEFLLDEYCRQAEDR